MNRPRLIGAAMVLSVLVIPRTVSVQSDGERTGSAADWPTVGGAWGNMRYSALGQISTANVTKLGGAWMSQKFDAPTSARAMAVVQNGVMFVTAPPSVYALNAKTGATIVEERLLHRIVHLLPLPSDQIDVLDDHHRRLQKPRKLEIVAQEHRTEAPSSRRTGAP